MNNSLSIVLSAEAGQGLQTIETFLIRTLTKHYHILTIKDVMSRVRGGNNSVEIRVSNQPTLAYQEGIDILFLLNDHSFERLANRIKPNTLIFTDENNQTNETLIKQSIKFIPIPLDQLSKDSGSILFRNTLLFGFIDSLFKCDAASGIKLIQEKYSHRDLSIQTNNIVAYKAGYDLANHYPLNNLPPNRPEMALSVIDGTDAIGLGAIAGGCNFIAAYPMSPGTGVLTYLASKSNDFDILVEQAEDEIAAINMTIGAWYAGARALTTTSGGGFALMTEGVSLSGITETPAVIHVGQRPGPGTGLPTRTEQGDLNLVVYAGHGEFPRLVYAPGHVKDAILLTQKAFYMADKYQIPVFILSDQFLLESISQFEPFNLEANLLKSNVVETQADYKRYALTANGLSPRGIPGFGQGLVKCDSDEHDESGQITENFDVRVLMNDKRLRKHTALMEESELPELYGPSNYKRLIIGWGSTFGVLKEYVDTNPQDETSFLYIKQPFPLHPHIGQLIKDAKESILFENNATGQLSKLIQLEFGIKVNQHVLKYNGLPFSIEEVEKKLKED